MARIDRYRSFINEFVSHRSLLCTGLGPQKSSASPQTPRGLDHGVGHSRSLFVMPPYAPTDHFGVRGRALGVSWHAACAMGRSHCGATCYTIVLSVDAPPTSSLELASQDLARRLSLHAMYASSEVERTFRAISGYVPHVLLLSSHGLGSRESFLTPVVELPVYLSWGSTGKRQLWSLVPKVEKST